jgi:tetratricopeptide (TPR) repeat protein
MKSLRECVVLDCPRAEVRGGTRLAVPLSTFPPSSNLLSAAIAALMLGFSICAAADERAEHAPAQHESSSIAAYDEAVRAAEQQHGARSEQVVAPLVALANAFARMGHHEEAIVPLQRAISIMRSQYGVFDVRQQDALKGLANSLVAVGRESEAEDLMIYRAHIAEKTYGEGSPKIIPPLCDLGDFFSEIGKAPEAHMTFNAALSIIGAGESMNDPIVIEPLRGIARTYMRRMSYPDGWRILAAKDRELRRDGEHALKRALRIVEADPSAVRPQTRIETLLQMGDWYQIKSAPSEALRYYERAWQLIRTTPNLPSSVRDALNVPLRVYYPTPSIVAHVPAQAREAESQYVQVELTVAADGSVMDAHIVSHDTRERYARDILDAVRNSRFRPKFVDGKTVAASGITYREVFLADEPAI